MARREAWEEVAAAVGGTVTGIGDVWESGGRVEAPVEGGPWTVFLDVQMVSILVGKVPVPMPFARALAPFPVQGEGLRLSVSRANPFTGIAKLFGMQDIEIGDAEFDRTFVLKGSDPLLAANLLGGEPGAPLRGLLEGAPDIHVGVYDDGREAWVVGPGRGDLPAGTDIVYAVSGGGGTERLVAAYRLVAETLRGLKRIGAAAADHGGPAAPI